MTLIVAMIRGNDTILLADRRISRHGQVFHEEFNKVIVLFCKDAKLALAFTGLATFGAFNTADWLASVLSEVATDEASITEILEVVRVALGPKIQSLGSDYDQLTILCAGYVYWTEEPESRIFEISNVGDGGSTLPIASLRVLSPNPTHEPVVELAGMSGAVPGRTIDRLRAMLSQPLQAQQVLRFAVAHLRNASSTSGSLNSIGEQCNSAVLQRAVDTVVTSTYHSAHNTNRAYGANVVIAGSANFLGQQMISPDILAGPEIRAKDSCWCGSGTSFGRCHLKKFGSTYARVPPFKQPLSMFVRVMREQPWPSGRAFMVSSSFV